MFKTKGKRGEGEGERERGREGKRKIKVCCWQRQNRRRHPCPWHGTAHHVAYMAPSVHFIHLLSPTDSRAPHVTTPSPASPHRHPPLNYFSHPFSNFFFIPTINEICLKIAQTCTTFFMQVLVIRLLVLGVPIIF